MAKGSETQEHIVRTALALADEHGVDALTLRALGRASGLHHTAIYRHFADRNAVLQAVVAMLVGEALDQHQPLPTEPRARLVTVFSLLRGILHAHPQVAATLLLPLASLSDSQPVAEIQAATVTALREMGLEGAALVVHHRLLESYVFGASVFDFGGAPDHLSSRAERLRLTQDEAFVAVGMDVCEVDRVNEEAFTRGLMIMLDASEAAGRAAGLPSGSVSR